MKFDEVARMYSEDKARHGVRNESYDYVRYIHLVILNLGRSWLDDTWINGK